MNLPTALFLAIAFLFALSFVIAICGMLGLAIYDWIADRLQRLLAHWRPA